MDFKPGQWQTTINPTDFINTNITPYHGDTDFLQPISSQTKAVWDQTQALLERERHAGGVLDIDTQTISTITSHPPGYIDQANEVIVGLQTDAPLKRAIKPVGGWRVVAKACQQQGYQLSDDVKQIFKSYRKTHNDGVFDVYTPEIKQLRKLGVITGLPDNYARGRIIGDYRRLPLYGIDRLIAAKQAEIADEVGEMTSHRIRLREELSEQIRALHDIKTMATSYGFDISNPATNATQAVQWLYFAYLAAVKEQDGAAMSLGNVASFLDIYIEHDLNNGSLTESQAQQLIDQFVIKLRLVRHLRTQEYDQLFAGDPTWVTLVLGGLSLAGASKVTKTDYRFLQTLYNLGPAPEPNITILWSSKLPDAFKHFASQVSIDTSSIQYINDDLTRDTCNSDDYGIACCVSQMDIGTQMQYFGARCNLAKILLLAINGGKDEQTGISLIPELPPLPSGPLDYKTVTHNFKIAHTWVIERYVQAMNIIHYMHDKYYYERSQMAFMDAHVQRDMAFGIAGLSVVTDSLSAIKHATVQAIRNPDGIATDFTIVGQFPSYGNDDDHADKIAVKLVKDFQSQLETHSIYRQATPTLSVLTITSNVVYGSHTGATPDGRAAGQPFAPGANPMHSRDTLGAIASLNSVAKLPYKSARDGISNTFSIVKSGLGADRLSQIRNLSQLLDGYTSQHGHHLNVNILDRALLQDAMDHPEQYPQLTIRVSGYAVHFTKLTRAQQLEVISRTFHQDL